MAMFATQYNVSQEWAVWMMSPYRTYLKIPTCSLYFNTCVWDITNGYSGVEHQCPPPQEVLDHRIYHMASNISAGVGSGNGLSSVRRQVIIGNNKGKFSIRPLRVYSWENSLKVLIQEIHCMMSSTKISTIFFRLQCVKQGVHLTPSF